MLYLMSCKIFVLQLIFLEYFYLLFKIQNNDEILSARILSAYLI